MSWSKNRYLAILLYILATISCYEVALSLSPIDHEMMCMKHEQWMAKHGRYYKNEEEKEKRFNIFKDNVQHIQSFNSEGGHKYKLAINKFADLTNEEFLAKHAGNLKPSHDQYHSNTSRFEYENVKDAPTSLDWRDHNAVTPIKNQGQCGCCWAFSAVAAIEGIVAIRSGMLTPLSEQDILDCNYAQEGCNGGRMDHAFDFVAKNGGLASETDYPYNGKQGACANNKPSSLASKITGFAFVPNNDEAALLAAVANQPVSVAIDPKLFQFYHSGVLTGECGTDLSHAVTVVGYGESEEGVKFWLVKNSWGGDWGDMGYAKLQRGIEAKEGMCGIAAFPSYPTA